ncbi:MAG: hypothetical protein BHW62_10190 [Acinetobacter sp. CAG:196_36_41]|nr:MAG: hypothetical protein BHW62_10190 [Acinetobacter sp. CAG:196_36_41]
MVNFFYNSDKLQEYLQLPQIYTLDDLAYFLLFTKEQLHDFSYRKNEHYVTFLIPKKNSTEKRVINAPKKRLKMAQKLILKEILEKVPCSSASAAFIKKENGLLKNALTHKENLFLLKMDFKNFFQNINEAKIIQIFENLGYSPYIALQLAKLCTFSKKLPQGGICSPYLSNLACYEFDKDISSYCDEKNIAYTRYADDLLFSANDIDLLKNLKNDIYSYTKKHSVAGLNIQINHKKTKLIKNTSHKKVTGITINDQKIKASKKLKNTIRQNIRYNLIHNQFDNKLIGKIAFVISIEDKEYKNRIFKYCKRIENKFKLNKKENQLLKVLYKMTK